MAEPVSHEATLEFATKYADFMEAVMNLSIESGLQIEEMETVLAFLAGSSVGSRKAPVMPVSLKVLEGWALATSDAIVSEMFPKPMGH